MRTIQVQGGFSLSRRFSVGEQIFGAEIQFDAAVRVEN